LCNYYTAGCVTLLTLTCAVLYFLDDLNYSLLVRWCVVVHTHAYTHTHTHTPYVLPCGIVLCKIKVVNKTVCVWMFHSCIFSNFFKFVHVKAIFCYIKPFMAVSIVPRNTYDWNNTKSVPHFSQKTFQISNYIMQTEILYS
jgi:hypothetical protein